MTIRRKSLLTFDKENIVRFFLIGNTSGGKSTMTWMVLHIRMTRGFNQTLVLGLGDSPGLGCLKTRLPGGWIF